MSTAQPPTETAPADLAGEAPMTQTLFEALLYRACNRFRETHNVAYALEEIAGITPQREPDPKPEPDVDARLTEAERVRLQLLDALLENRELRESNQRQADRIMRAAGKDDKGEHTWADVVKSPSWFLYAVQYRVGAILGVLRFIQSEDGWGDLMRGGVPAVATMDVVKDLAQKLFDDLSDAEAFADKHGELPALGKVEKSAE